MRVVECFRLVGRVMGKALLDERPLDLPLSGAVFRWMVGQPLCLHDMLYVDPALYATLCKVPPRPAPPLPPAEVPPGGPEARAALVAAAGGGGRGWY